MRNLSAALIVGTSLLFMSTTANAGNTKRYKSTIQSIPAASIQIEVGLSEDLAFRAENYGDGLKQCSISSKNRSSGFACDGYFGERDLTSLTKRIKKSATHRLTKKGITISDDAELVLKLTLVDVQNNRPTIKQLGQKIGLSFKSIQLGGADFEGELFTKDGRSLGTMSYSYYDTIFDEFAVARATWTDTHKAIQRFSTKLAKDLSKRRKNS